MLRIVVVGRGLRGLVASWVLAQHPGIKVESVGAARLLPDSALDEVSPGSTSLRNLLQALGVPHSAFRPRLGTLRGGRVRGKRNKSGAPRIRFGAEELAESLREAGGQPRHVANWRAEPGELHANGTRLRFDYLLLAEPLSECQGRVWFRLAASPAPLHEALVAPRGQSPFWQWEEIMTPATPRAAVRRIFCHAELCIAESTEGGYALLGDLDYLFPGGFKLRCIREQRTRAVTRLPENVAMVPQALPLGDTVDLAYELLRRWTTRRRKLAP